MVKIITYVLSDVTGLWLVGTRTVTVMDNRSTWAAAKYGSSIVDTGDPRKALVWSWWAPVGCLLNEWMKEKACEFFLLRLYFFGVV